MPHLLIVQHFSYNIAYPEATKIKLTPKYVFTLAGTNTLPTANKTFTAIPSW
jgi:hypothetical protein